MGIRTAPLAAALAALLLATGCYTRHVRQDVYAEREVEVFLRTDRRNFSQVEKGYDHPATISSVRVAHILSRIDVRKAADEGGRRVPAVATKFLYAIADGVSKALARATPDQEVVVMVTESKRTLKLFEEQYVTALVAWVRGEQLFFYVERTDWLYPGRRGTEVPQPRVGQNPTKLKIFPDTAMTLLDTHTVAVDWRDPIFAKPTRTRILPTGEVVRKTILLDTPPDQLPVEGDEAGEVVLPPEGLTPGQLRALADLEEERLSGRITEGEYRIRQREILESQ